MEGVEPPTAWFVARYSIQLSYMRASNSHFINEFNKMAEKEGFEPSMGFKAHTPLAGERLRPLGHLSGMRRIILGRENKSNSFYGKY